MGFIYNPPTPQSIGAVPDSRQLIAGANVTIDGGASANLDADITIASSGGGGGGGGGGGMWTFLTSENAANSGNIDFDISAYVATYDQIKIVMTDLILSAAAELFLQVGTGGPIVFDTGNNYDFGIFWFYGTSGTGSNSRAFVSATSSIRMGTVSTASQPNGVPLSLEAIIQGLATGLSAFVSQGRSDYNGGSGLTTVFFNGVHNLTDEITGLRFAPVSGLITSGNIALYGRSI